MGRDILLVAACRRHSVSLPSGSLPSLPGHSSYHAVHRRSSTSASIGTTQLISTLRPCCRLRLERAAVYASSVLPSTPRPCCRLHLGRAAVCAPAVLPSTPRPCCRHRPAVPDTNLTPRRPAAEPDAAYRVCLSRTLLSPSVYSHCAGILLPSPSASDGPGTCSSRADVRGGGEGGVEGRSGTGHTSSGCPQTAMVGSARPAAVRWRSSCSSR